MELEAYDKKSDHTHIINNDHSDGRAIFKKCPKCGRFYNGGEYYCNCCHVKLEIIEENKKVLYNIRMKHIFPNVPRVVPLISRKYPEYLKQPVLPFGVYYHKRSRSSGIVIIVVVNGKNRED